MTTVVAINGPWEQQQRKLQTFLELHNEESALSRILPDLNRLQALTIRVTAPNRFANL